MVLSGIFPFYSIPSLLPLGANSVASRPSGGRSPANPGFFFFKTTPLPFPTATFHDTSFHTECVGCSIFFVSYPDHFQTKSPPEFPSSSLFPLNIHMPLNSPAFPYAFFSPLHVIDPSDFLDLVGQGLPPSSHNDYLKIYQYLRIMFFICVFMLVFFLVHFLFSFHQPSVLQAYRCTCIRGEYKCSGRFFLSAFLLVCLFVCLPIFMVVQYSLLSDFYICVLSTCFSVAV